ncbi:MAG: hypothetical protein WBA74_23495, partial [Cyclobacteriaceae bacterium]
MIEYLTHTQKQLEREVFEEKYPAYDPYDKKTHILYLAPTVDDVGFYRSFVPSHSLNEYTTSHVALVGQFHKSDFTKHSDQYDTRIDKRLILWAHYIILPTHFTDATYIIRMIDEINPKAKLVMDIDRHYHLLSQSLIFRRKIKKSMLQTLEQNLLRMDLITTCNKKIAVDYSAILDATKSIKVLPSFTPVYQARSRDPLASPTKKYATKIGIIGNPSEAENIYSIKILLSRLAEFYGHFLEIIIFGWDGKYGQDLLLHDIPFTYVKPCSIHAYFETIKSLELDIALIPERYFSHRYSKASLLYYELSNLKIPVIASSTPTFYGKISHGKNGYLAHT